MELVEFATVVEEAELDPTLQQSQEELQSPLVFDQNPDQNTVQVHQHHQYVEKHLENFESSLVEPPCEIFKNL